MDGFYLQFFVHGYDAEIEFIDDSQGMINSIKDTPNRRRPIKMIASFNDYYYNVYFELPEAGYGGGSKFVLRTAFCSTLPELFDAFLDEGRTTISNYEAITTRINAFKPIVSRICKRRYELEEDEDEDDDSEVEIG
jgi:hypothetical protein